jgi:hypothetical protein
MGGSAGRPAPALRARRAAVRAETCPKARRALSTAGREAPVSQAPVQFITVQRMHHGHDTNSRGRDRRDAPVFARFVREGEMRESAAAERSFNIVGRMRAQMWRGVTDSEGADCRDYPDTRGAADAHRRDRAWTWRHDIWTSRTRARHGVILSGVLHTSCEQINAHSKGNAPHRSREPRSPLKPRKAE